MSEMLAEREGLMLPNAATSPGVVANDRRAAVSLSRRVWQLDWSEHLPLQLDSVSVVHASFDAAVPFMRDHYGTIFEAEARGERFLADPMTAAKSRFCHEMDVFLFKDADATVGVLMSHPADWSTYYMRSAAFLPEYRAKNLLSRCVEAMYAPLHAVGVERVEVECAASNAVVVRMLAGLGFTVTSTTNSERYGAMVRFTKFLQKNAEATFLRQFCALSMQKPRTPNEERKTS